MNFLFIQIIFSFQDSASPIMVGIQNFHHYIFFYLIGIFVVVFWMFYFIIDTYLNIQNYNINNNENQLIFRYELNQYIKNLFHNTFLEIIWTFIPAIILILIAIPSLSLLYAMDEPYDVKFTALITGFQWYWAYMIPAMYSTFININKEKVFNLLLNEYFLIYNNNKNKNYFKNIQFINNLISKSNIPFYFLHYNNNNIKQLTKLINKKLFIPINTNYSILINLKFNFLNQYNHNYSYKFYQFIHHNSFYQKKINFFLEKNNFFYNFKFKFNFKLIKILKFFINANQKNNQIFDFETKKYFLLNYGKNYFNKFNFLNDLFPTTIFNLNNLSSLHNFVHNYDYRLFLKEFGYYHNRIKYLNIINYFQKLNNHINYYNFYNNNNIFFPNKNLKNNLFKKFILNKSFFSTNYQINKLFFEFADYKLIDPIILNKYNSIHKKLYYDVYKYKMINFCQKNIHHYSMQLITSNFIIKNYTNIIYNNNNNNFNFIIKLNLENINKNLNLFKINKLIYLQKFDSYPLQGEDLKIGFHRNLEVTRALNLPLKTHIRLHITSMDVLHSWAVPSLGIKVDAVPGRINQALLYLERRGTFYGQCSELCGANHGFMPIAIKSIDAKKFWQN
jgi:heme/copper-type cytochrome/quinol oxidase subunit 2